jgi:iron complex transport system ATP-binding protein
MADPVDALVAHAVSVRLGAATLVHQVELPVPAGALCGVLGPNGAGKSTLLKVLAGELRPSAGEVSLNGTRLRHWSHGELARQRAVLPQIRALGFGFTVEELAALGLSPHPSLTRDRSQAGAIVDAALGAADIAHLRGRLVPTLSGGEAQRAHLARVLAQIWRPTPRGPRYLLLDEPTSALDPAHQHGLLATVRRLARELDLGVLVVLHDLNLAALYTDRIALLRAGERVAFGPPPAVLTRELIREVYGLAVDVIPHPAHPRVPLVVGRGPAEAPSGAPWRMSA